ncbi:MAG: hypothetical protein BWK78_01260 [Thiotrichaceae bacterium IS1]|nr:MAG: hypothetical protein BWK78_01260 [Thiotrichaceae bacterium IS1]
MNNQHNNWVKFIFLSTLWATLYPLLAQSENGGQMCADVITYGKNPNTGEWQTFSTPCAVPQGWQSSLVKPDSSVRADTSPTTTDTKEVCEQVITYGKNPKTEEWEEFPTPCEVPDGWEKSQTKPDTGTSGSVTPSGETSSSSDNTTSGNQDACPEKETIYAQHPTSKLWYVFTNSCEVPTGWTNSKTEGGCAEIIIYGQSPKTGKWYPFATPCDIPTQWEPALIKPATNGTPQPGMTCDDTIAYAQNLTTQNAYAFSNSCDVPEGEEWKRLLSKPANLKPDKVDCPPVTIYAQHPEKKTWYAFPTVCEVPDGWIKSATPPPVTEGEDCSSVKATYSPTDWKVHIPFIFLNNTDIQPAFEDAELELLSTQVTPYLFFVSKVKVPEKVPEKVEDSQP